MADPKPPQSTPPSQDVYDRQIRLWGADAQSKISSATVLYIHITGVSSEILKNLVLAGVRPAICDGRPYPEAVMYTPSSFLPPGERTISEKDKSNDTNTTNCVKVDNAASTTEDDNRNGKKEENDGNQKKRQRIMSVARAMQPHVQELNPLLDSCEIEERDVEDIPDDFFAKFDIVIASRLGLKQASRIASVTTAAGGFFYLVDCFGLRGCAISDLGPNHTFRREIGKDKLSDPISPSTYVAFKDIIQVKLSEATDRWNKKAPHVWVAYRSFLQFQSETGKWPGPDNREEFAKFTKQWLVDNSQGEDDETNLPAEFLGSDEELQNLASLALAEISPVCAVLGGVLGNEVIKALSGKGQPANNVLLFDGTDGGCKTFLVRSKS